jgi:hypothetical protein
VRQPRGQQRVAGELVQLVAAEGVAAQHRLLERAAHP